VRPRHSAPGTPARTAAAALVTYGHPPDMLDFHCAHLMLSEALSMSKLPVALNLQVLLPFQFMKK
jgi:hypothetical protein